MEEELEGLRRDTGLTQKEFAKRMGIPLRTYEDILSKKRVRQVHLNAAQWAMHIYFMELNLAERADQIISEEAQ